MPGPPPRACTQATVDSAAKRIQWSALAPSSGKPFIDPFTKLSGNQIADLSFVVQVRRQITQNQIPADGEDAKEAAELAEKLEQQGIDIGWLVAQRERVQQIRGLQVKNLSNAIAKSLQNQTVVLTGFVIPLTVDEGVLKEFFLVPTVASCSHEGPPPRLQVVFVATETGMVAAKRHTPVQVTGKLSAEPTSEMIVNASGQMMIHAAYAISSPEVRLLQIKPDVSN